MGGTRLVAEGRVSPHLMGVTSRRPPLPHGPLRPPVFSAGPRPSPLCTDRPAHFAPASSLLQPQGACSCPGRSLRLGGRRAGLPRRVTRGPQAAAPTQRGGRLALDPDLVHVQLTCRLRGACSDGGEGAVSLWQPHRSLPFGLCPVRQSPICRQGLEASSDPGPAARPGWTRSAVHLELLTAEAPAPLIM